MKSITATVYFAIACLGLSGVADASILAKWEVSSGGNGHYYEFVDFGTEISWTFARDNAQTRSHLGAFAHLVTVTSAEEDDFLKSAFSSVIGDPNTNVPGVYAWIGLSDVGVEGNFQWVTGEAFSYSNWAPPEPNNLGNEDHVAVWQRRFTGSNPDPLGVADWSWNDFKNNTGSQSNSAMLIEFDGPFNAAVPEPSTFVLISIGFIGLVVFGRRRSPG